MRFDMRDLPDNDHAIDLSPNMISEPNIANRWLKIKGNGSE